MKKNEEIQEDVEEKMIISGKRVGKSSTLFLEQKKFENFGETKEEIRRHLKGVFHNHLIIELGLSCLEINESKLLKLIGESNR